MTRTLYDVIATPERLVHAMMGAEVRAVRCPPGPMREQAQRDADAFRRDLVRKAGEAGGLLDVEVGGGVVLRVRS